MRHPEDTARVAGYLEKIGASSRYLLGLINDILDMARMEHGAVRLECRQFRLRSCVEESLAPFRIQAEAHGKTLKEDFQAGDPSLMGDPFRLQQILNNLLSNAFRFTPEDGTVSLSVSRMEGGEYAKYKFVVADTGIGMSPEFQERLFEPYAREMRFSDRRAVGTGLGMSITKSLVSLMDGEIQVESAPGRGTAFTVILPFAAAAEDWTPPEAREARPPFSMEGFHILLAEDNEINMEIAAELLAARGVQVTRAWNGEEAVSRFREAPVFTFDAVLLDMQMPVMDGCQAAEQIRGMDRADAQSVPIIAVTANAFSEDVAATTAAGMNAHVSKPIDFAVLRQTLERLLGAPRKLNARGPAGE